VTAPVLVTVMDTLMKRSFVRLRCGLSGQERKALARQLEALLDCLVVHQIGFTITLYRAQGLARPQGCSCSSGSGAAGGHGGRAEE
jgi:RNA-binding protein YhbY